MTKNKRVSVYQWFSTLSEVLLPLSSIDAFIVTHKCNIYINKLIPSKTGEALKTRNPKTPRFYMLPKVHKPNNPGRPVVSSVACHSSLIYKYVDFHLNPVTQRLSSYIRDTTDFINKLSAINDLPKSMILISMDVRSLYTNIPTNGGLDAVKLTLNEPMNKNSLKASPIVILELLKLTLTCNNFEFNCKHFLQIKGCAMGTICAPSYANIFMGIFQKQYIYPFIESNTKLYLRYIDDIFILWTSTRQQFENFISELNQKHSSIKFDYEMSSIEIPFLDTIVYIDNKNHLQTRLYRKTTDRQNYLLRASEHPPSLKDSLAHSQALRIKRVCSDNEEYKSSSEQLVKSFISRGYDQEQVAKQVRKVDSKSSDALLRPEANNITTNRTTFVTTYNRTLPPIDRILHKN